LNFFEILSASSSFETTTISSIRFETDKVCKTSSNINLQIMIFFSSSMFNRVLALENVFTGIIADVFKLDVNLF